ncbi:MAG: hypothetical protein MUE44_04655 [Oscillatoriaceae cyanobacterium Prado104]|nr:hypothetical protein [Oscillatoriaceae cyanobacterium Prado104]
MTVEGRRKKEEGRRKKEKFSPSPPLPIRHPPIANPPIPQSKIENRKSFDRSCPLLKRGFKPGNSFFNAPRRRSRRSLPVG